MLDVKNEKQIPFNREQPQIESFAVAHFRSACFWKWAAIKRFDWAVSLLAGIFLWTSSPHMYGDTVVRDNSLASLQAAVSAGGTISFSMTGTVVVTSTILIPNNTVLIDTNHSVVISGGS